MRPSLPVVSDSGERARQKKGVEQEAGQGRAGVIGCVGESRSESKLGTSSVGQPSIPEALSSTPSTT